MKDDATLLPEERLALLSDEIIQSILGTSEVATTNRKFLFQQLEPNLFRDENYIIYKVFYSFKDRDVVPNSSFLKIYFSHNTKLFSQSDKYINLTEFQDDDDSPYVAYAGAVMKKFDRLSQQSPVDFEEFKLDVEKYREDFAVLSMDKSFGTARQILFDGVRSGREFKQGYNDSVAYIKKSIASVDALVNRGTGDGFIDSSTAAMDSSVQTEYEKVGEFDLLPELNERMGGGIFTDLFYNICAPTKGGKSKFTARMAHTVAVQYGVPITVWAVEGGYKAWWAQLRAIHYEYMYIRNKPDDKRVAPLSQKDILFGNYPSEDTRQLEEASRIDLFGNSTYGKISMIDRPFEVETFIDSIDTSVQLNHSKFVLVDYLQLIQSQFNAMSKSQAISLAYQKALAYCNVAHVAFVSPSQFKQEFMVELAKSNDGKSNEIRTAGGESSEVTRTPDINIALYATVEDLMRNRMQILSMPSRMCPPFPTMDIYADLCSCVFSEMKDD